jgi:hypothetical protein
MLTRCGLGEQTQRPPDGTHPGASIPLRRRATSARVHALHSLSTSAEVSRRPVIG